MSPNIYHVQTSQIKYLDRYKGCFIQFIIFVQLRRFRKKPIEAEFILVITSCIILLTYQQLQLLRRCETLVLQLANMRQIKSMLVEIIHNSGSLSLSSTAVTLHISLSYYTDFNRKKAS